ncbi:MAG: hypothetical protein NC102_00720 [Clostridium sp.]|nr:hypothetical protein [Clostridium sp.]
MKKFLALTAAVAAMVAFSSCDNRPNPAGQWTGTISENVPGQQKTMDVTLAFDKAGNVQADYEITIVEDLNGNDSILSPFQASVTASVSQSGTWQYVDHEDDEILVKFDRNSIKVDVAPDKVEYRVNALTGQESPNLEALTPAFVAKYTQMLKSDFAANGSTLLLDDVKVSKTMMKFEIGKKDYVFTGAKSK